MKKRMFRILISMAVVFTAVMFGTVGISAGEPLECSDGTFTIEPALTNFESGDPQPFPRASEGDECGEGNSGWVWEYSITSATEKAMNNLTKMHVYIPSLPPNTIKILDGSFQRGVGSTVKGYGTGIYNGFVLTRENLAGNVLEKRISFCTDVNTTGTISMAFETSRTLTGCESEIPEDPEDPELYVQGPLGGIIGPGFMPSEFVAVETDRKVNLGPDGHIWAKKHPVTGCIKSFYYYDEVGDPGHETPIPIMPLAGPPDWMAGVGEEVLDIGDFESPMCREAVIARKGSPITYWGYANGMYYCLGKYDSKRSPYWFNPCSTY